MAQWYAVIDDTKYGPVDDAVLRQWIAEGRLRGEHLVWQEGMGDWVPAETLPELFPAGAGASMSAPTGGPSARPPLDGLGGSTPTGAATKPHRGTMILIFGIIGLVCCVIFGIVAWVMGKKDLAEMDAGLMDPSGRGLTNAGKILGIISVVLTLIYVIINAILVATGAGTLTFSTYSG